MDRYADSGNFCNTRERSGRFQLHDHTCPDNHILGIRLILSFQGTGIPLYKHVSNLGEDNIDFSMDTSIPACQNSNNKFGKCVTSPTELFFYLPVLVLVVAIIMITSFCGA